MPVSRSGFLPTALFVVFLFFPLRHAQSVALLQRDSNNRYLIYQAEDSIRGQECGTLKPDLTDPVAAAQACNKHTGKEGRSVSTSLYEQSFQSLYGILTPLSVERVSLLELALEEERAQRESHSLAKINQESAVDSVLGRILPAYVNLLDPLLDGNLKIDSEDPVSAQVLLESFSPIFFDGKMVVRVTPPVSGVKYKDACGSNWVPMSIVGAASLTNREDFVAWLKMRLPKEKPLFWSAHYWMQEHTIEGSTAVDFNSALYGLYVDADFLKASASFPPVTLNDWNKHVRDFAFLTTRVVIGQNENNSLRVLCFRRAFPDALREKAKLADGDSVATVAQKFRLSDGDVFRRVLLQYPELDRGTASLNLLQNIAPSLGDIKLIESPLRSFFRMNDPTVEEVRNTISARKAREAKKAKEERLEAQLAAAEEARWRANQVVIGGVHPRTILGALTLDGRTTHEP